MNTQPNNAEPQSPRRLDGVDASIENVEATDLQIEEAKILLARGDLDGAEKLIASMPHNTKSLDLAARLGIRKGDWRSARAAWERLLQVEPDNSKARDALDRLSSTWLFKAVVARFFYLAALAVLIAFSAAGLFYIVAVLPNPVGTSPTVLVATRSSQPIYATSSLLNPEEVDVANLVSRLTIGGDYEVPPAEADTEDHVTFKTPPPERLSVPNIVISGATVSASNSDVSIVFDEGLFRFRRDFSESAEDMLQKVVDTLADGPPIERIHIYGHTDNVPMPARARYNSNYALGLARAAAVASWFRKNMDLSPEAFVAKSQGENNPPFPNEDHDPRRNRTVVLRIQFQQAPEGNQL